MTRSEFSLTWEEHRNNIFSGLSSLQQNGEFVDMTIAADGHYVKVHQIVIALASPYIKEILHSFECSHPVIFLNKISYTTLCYILEYIYTGEIIINMDHLDELIDAAKDLQIKGLQDMKLQEIITGREGTESTSRKHVNGEEENFNNTEKLFNLSRESNVEEDSVLSNAKSQEYNVETEVMFDEEHVMEEIEETDMDMDIISMKENRTTTEMHSENMNLIQYTISNQGNLQMILNRYLYYLKYSKQRNRTRQWRCVDYLNKIKCPAFVITKDGIAVLRSSVHTHPFHDKKILKKVRDGRVFSAIQDAEMTSLKINNGDTNSINLTLDVE